MIGTITVADNTATLEDDETWSSDDELLSMYLNATHNPKFAEGLEALLGPRGTIISAADDLKCKYYLVKAIEPLLEMGGDVDETEEQARAAAEIMAGTMSEEDIEEFLSPTVDEVVNAFCPTGEGGGVDPTCSPGTVKTWVKGSHKDMFDDSGEPREFYHGTTKEFAELKPSSYGAAGAGIYLSTTKNKAESFADREGGRLLTVYAKLKNPLRVPYNETHNAREWAERARKSGHDGLLIPGQGEILVFNPSDVMVRHA